LTEKSRIGKKAMHKYKIHPNEEGRETLTEWVKKGAGKAKVIQQAQVLLGSDEVKGRVSRALPLVGT
jgi:hypothetical protein